VKQRRMVTAALKIQADLLVDELRQHGLKIASAESCTGGLIAAVLTDGPGASDVVDRGFVTYSNAAKSAMLGVSGEAISTFGAVSREVAEAMAAGALVHSLADVSVAVTGLAGPGGGSLAKPVGLVHIAAARRGGAILHEECRFGPLSRSDIRERAVIAAVVLVRRLLEAGDGQA
jgi:nicotinamide-nucleotide amidase